MEPQLLHYRNKLAFEIDSWDLKVARESGSRITLIDARSRQAFARERIPGAISLPHREMSPESTAALDRGALVVTYCAASAAMPRPRARSRWPSSAFA